MCIINSEYGSNDLNKQKLEFKLKILSAGIMFSVFTILIQRVSVLIFAKLHYTQSNAIGTVDYDGARWKDFGFNQSLGFVLWGLWISVQNVWAIHQRAVEIFQSGPKGWTDRLSLYDTKGIYLETTSILCALRGAASEDSSTWTSRFS